MSSKLVMILADGFEETEALAPTDFLRRLGFELVLAGLSGKMAKGSHGISVAVDVELAAIDYLPDVLILPGGMPGSVNLRDSDLVIRLIRNVAAAQKPLAAICAAPIALHAAGVTKGRTLTSHPSVKELFTDCVHTGRRVERDGQLVTAMGPGTAFEFAAAIADLLGKGTEATQLLKDMFIVTPL